MHSGQRDRTNKDGAATEELAKLVAVGVGGELRTEPDRGGNIFRCGASNRRQRLPRRTAIEQNGPNYCRVAWALGFARK